MNRWYRVKRTNPIAARIADRHYSRISPGTNSYTGPARTLCLMSHSCDAIWASQWPFSEYVKRAYPNAWLCSMFRNESPYLASELIREAVAITRYHFVTIPTDGMITTIDTRYVNYIMKRGKRDYGRTFELAGFEYVGDTKKGLMIFQLKPCNFPDALEYQWLEEMHY